MRGLASFVLALGVVLAAGEASGYVRSRSNACNPTYWPQQCVFVTLDGNGASNNGVVDSSLDNVVASVQQAINAWSSQEPGAGSFMQLQYYPADGPRDTVLDYIPVIKFRYDTCATDCGGNGWCRPGTGGNKSTCYDRSAAALTTVFFYDTPSDRSKDGEIIDADIELNAVFNHFYYEGMEAKPVDFMRSTADIWNTVVHELGHLQGLEHTCLATTTETSSCTVDQNGQRAPLCNSVINGAAAPGPDQATDQTILKTTMFATAAPDEIGKRHPQADDLAGVTAAYPTAELAALGKPADPFACIAPEKRSTTATPFGGGSSSSGGCTVSGRAPMTTTNGTPAAATAGLLLCLGVTLALRARSPRGVRRVTVRKRDLEFPSLRR